MTWNELLKEIESLTPEQREQTAQVWGERITLSECYSIEIADEDMYLDRIFGDTYAVGESGLTEEDEEDYVKVCDKGSLYILIE